MKKFFLLVTAIWFVFSGVVTVSVAVAEMDIVTPIDRELQHNRALVDEPLEFVVHPDGQWWPKIGYVTVHDMVNGLVMQFDLTEFGGQQFERVKFKFYVQEVYQMLETFLAVRFYGSGPLLSQEDYDPGPGNIIAGSHLYSGDVLLQPTVHYSTPDAEAGLQKDIRQWVTYDVTELINARTSDHVFFNLRFEGDPPPDPADPETAWNGNEMLFNDSDRHHYIQVAAADNQPLFRPHLHLQSLPVTYPTEVPESVQGSGIVVCEKEYTAVGYDYGSILPYGQEFQNCVFEPTTGLLYVIDNNNEDQGGTIGETDQVMVINPNTGIILSAFNTPLAKTHSYCLTLGGNGNLIFAERGHTPIYEIETNGTLVGDYAIDIAENPPAPWPGVQRDGFAYNPNLDTYYITENNFSRVTRDDEGNFIRHETHETEPYGCRNPKGIVYNANHNSLMMIDDSSDQIWKFGLDGTYICGGGDDTRSVEMPEYFDKANGIAFDPATGRIFLTGVDSRDGHAILNVLTPVAPVTPPPATGDIDGNDAVNRDDLILLLNCRNQPPEACPGADMNDDGNINSLDLRQVVLACDRPRCATEECFSFTKNAQDLDVSDVVTQVSNRSFFEYKAGPDHSTSVTFDLYLDGSLFSHVGPVPVNGTSGLITLPVYNGPLTVELRNVACPAGVGSCVDGTITSWGGECCITP